MVSIIGGSVTNFENQIQIKLFSSKNIQQIRSEERTGSRRPFDCPRLTFEPVGDDLATGSGTEQALHGEDMALSIFQPSVGARRQRPPPCRAKCRRASRPEVSVIKGNGHGVGKGSGKGDAVRRESFFPAEEGEETAAKEPTFSITKARKTSCAIKIFWFRH